jgi:hypothetical protein
VNVGQLMSDVVSALAVADLPLPRRRIIAALMLTADCSFEDAAAALSAAVRKHLSEYSSCHWQGDLHGWVTAASIALDRLQHERQRGSLRQLFPGGAKEVPGDRA